MSLARSSLARFPLPHRRENITAAQERAIDEYLRSKGMTVGDNPAEAQGGGDRVVDGEPTEYKTLTDIADPDEDKLSKVIARVARKARSQARHFVIDGRSQPGLTEAAAVRGIRRAFGADRATAQLVGGEPKIESVRVILNDADGVSTDIILARSG